MNTINENTAMLVAKDLTKTLHGEIPVTLVKNSSLKIKQNEIVSITGPSGSGKSSLLYLLGLLDAPNSGTITIDGVNTSKLSDEELADFRLEKLGFVFQFHFLIPELTALENVMLPMKRLNKLNSNSIELRAKKLLSELSLENELNKKPKQLSGGQSQRVAIARALANEPKLILADEPTGNLDTKASENVIEILRNLDNTSVVIVTHDKELANKCDRNILIVDGYIK